MKVGDTLYFVYSGNYPSAPEVVTVLALGRKWATLSNGYRIEVETLRAERGKYSSPGRAWETKKEYDAIFFAATLWKKFRILVDAVRADNDFTAKQIVAAAAALGIDLDPKGTL